MQNNHIHCVTWQINLESDSILDSDAQIGRDWFDGEVGAYLIWFRLRFKCVSRCLVENVKNVKCSNAHYKMRNPHKSIHKY